MIALLLAFLLQVQRPDIHEMGNIREAPERDLTVEKLVIYALEGGLEKGRWHHDHAHDNDDDGDDHDDPPDNSPVEPFEQHFHFTIYLDGTIVQFVDSFLWSRHSFNPNTNDCGVGILIFGSTHDEDTWNQAVIDSLAQLLAYLSWLHGVPLEHVLTGVPKGVLGNSVLGLGINPEPHIPWDEIMRQAMDYRDSWKSHIPPHKKRGKKVVHHQGGGSGGGCSFFSSESESSVWTLVISLFLLVVIIWLFVRQWSNE